MNEREWNLANKMLSELKRLREEGIVIGCVKCSNLMRVQCTNPPVITHGLSLPAPDSIVETVIEKYHTRSKQGIAKYGTSLDRTDLDLQAWLTHLQEELMDATLYVEKLKQELPK